MHHVEEVPAEGWFNASSQSSSLVEIIYFLLTPFAFSNESSRERAHCDWRSPHPSPPLPPPPRRGDSMGLGMRWDCRYAVFMDPVNY